MPRTEWRWSYAVDVNVVNYMCVCPVSCVLCAYTSRKRGALLCTRSSASTPRLAASS